MPHSLHHRPHGALAADAVVFRFFEGELRVLLIKRLKEPFKGIWALPAGFLEDDEDAETAIIRELKEETGLSNIHLEQFYTFTKPNRHPEGRVVSIAYLGVVQQSPKLNASHDAEKPTWISIEKLPKLAFDHLEIIEKALFRLRENVRLKDAAFHLLPEKFTLSELQNMLEKILMVSLDKRNFRKKVLSMGFIHKTEHQVVGKKSRPAYLYTFDQEIFNSEGQMIL